MVAGGVGVGFGLVFGWGSGVVGFLSLSFGGSWLWSLLSSESLPYQLS